MMADGRSSFSRKNIFTGIRIFQNAFDGNNNAHLTIKLRNMASFPEFREKLERTTYGRTNITVLAQTLTAKARWDLINDHDLILSPHRAEGYGLHLAEGMALGKCVVATGWSGNLQFMNEHNSVLLPFKRVPVEDSFGVYDQVENAHWADVDEPAAVAALQALEQAPKKRDEIGATARRDILNALSNRAVLEIIKQELPIR